MHMLDRRMLLRAGAAAAGAAALAPTVPARAHAPQAGKRAQPGFYRFKLGTIEVTVVSDGTLAFPAETLWGDRAEDARGLLTSTFQPSSPVGLQINTILVNTGDKLVLIDAGCGVDKFQKTTGGLIGNLAAAGYAPDDIDMILFTHAHFDHLWGISDHENASLLFPSAEFVASEAEVAFWSAPEWANRLSPALKPEVTRANLELASPRLRLIKAAAEVAPGVTTFDTAGHTPGHISVHISSGSEQMLLTGDVVVNSTVSFLHPEWPFGFDMDVPLATKARMAFLDRAAADKTLVGSYHLPFPGFGHVVRERSGYRWLTADWQWTSDFVGRGRCAPPPASSALRRTLNQRVPGSSPGAPTITGMYITNFLASQCDAAAEKAGLQALLAISAPSAISSRNAAHFSKASSAGHRA